MDFQKHCTCASQRLQTLWQLVSTVDLLVSQFQRLPLGDPQISVICQHTTSLDHAIDAQREALTIDLEYIALEEPRAVQGLRMQLNDFQSRYNQVVERYVDKVYALQGEKRVYEGSPLS